VQVEGLMAGCEYGPDGKCGRKIAARGMCHSHCRMWLAGKPLDTPIRGYQIYGEGPDGKPVPARTRPASALKRRKPFEAEYALLRSLGLR
jgi:hypothetical protein